MNAEALHGDEPKRRIAPRAIRVWQWSAAFGNLVYFGLPVFYLLLFGSDPLIHKVIPGILATGALAYWILGVTLLPYLQWKRWRYGIDRNEIDLKRGIVVRSRTLIPLNRVQHVDTRQGPFLRYYGLAAVTISTAATTHEIPALDERSAAEVRDLISRYARLAEEDV